MTHKRPIQQGVTAATAVAAMAAAMKSKAATNFANESVKAALPAVTRQVANLYSAELGSLLADRPKSKGRSQTGSARDSTLPAAYPQVTRTKSSLSTTKDGGLRIRRSNLITTIDGAGTDFTAGSTYPLSVQTFVCNPLVGNTFPWLVEIASRFGRVKVNSMSMTYDPAVGTLTAGQVCLAWTPDVSTNAPYSFDAICSNEGAVKGPVYSPMTVQCPVKGGTTYRYTAGNPFGAILNLLTEDYRTLHPQGAGSDPYWSTFGQVIVASQMVSSGGVSYTGLIGSLTVHYDIELFEPVYSLTREAYTASSTFRWTLPKTVNMPTCFDNSNFAYRFEGFNSSIAWPSSPNFLVGESAHPELTDGKSLFFPVPGEYAVQFWTASPVGTTNEIVSISAVAREGVIDLNQMRVNGDINSSVGHVAYLTTVAPNASIVYGFTRPNITQQIEARVIVQHSVNRNFSYGV